MDHYEDDESPNLFGGMLSNFFIITVGLIVLTIIVGLSLAAVVSEKNPQAYIDFITASLGETGEIPVHTQETVWTVETPRETIEQVNSTIRPFYLTYWNAQQLLFYVPEGVWSAAIAANQKYSWCDPRFIVALAHSESSVFNNNICSSAGACGTWQFMPGTWTDLWKGVKPIPDRTNRIAAADAACRYTKANGMIDALDSKQAFIREFASDPPVWNAYPPQAEYVFDLYNRIKNNGDQLPEPSHSGPVYAVTGTWWKQPAIWLLKSFGVWPETLAFRLIPTGEIQPAEGDDLLALPESAGIITWGLHGQNYGDCAIDISGGKDTVVISPINGEITQKFIDGYGNPTIRIENSVYIVDLLHGNWSIQIGDKLNIGQIVGSESNRGFTFGYGGRFCGTASDCGYHVHFDVVRKGQPCVDPQTLINWPPAEGE